MQRQEGGAPADFNGPVFPNPDHIQISDDTDSGIPDLRLPNGVQAVTGAYNGTPKLDTSNPTGAQVLPAAMQTIASNSSPVTLDMSTAQPIQNAPVTLDMSTAQPLKGSSETHTPEQKGIIRKAWDWANKGLISGDTLLNIAGETAPTKPKDMKPGETTVDYLKRVRDEVDPNHPFIQAIKTGLAGVNLDAYNVASGFTSPISIATLLAGPAGKAPGAAGKAARALSGAASTAFAAKGAGDVYEAATDESKDTATRLQEGLQGAAMVAGGTAGAAENAKPAANAVVERVKPVARKVTPKQAAQTVASIGTVAAGHASPLSLLLEGPMAGKYAGKATEFLLGKERANTPILRAKSALTPGEAEPFEGVSSPQTESAGETPAEQAPEETPKNAAAARANGGASARQQARLRAVERAKVKTAQAETAAEDFREDQTSAQIEGAGQLPSEHVPEDTAPQNAIASRASVTDTSPKNVKKLLNQATGAAPESKVVPGVKIKNQPVAQAAKLPEGFTPTPESSHLKGYKYDPSTQEFDAITQTGARYRHGNVSPEQFAKFEAAKSKGSAWNSEIKNGPGVTPLGKPNAEGIITNPRNKPQFMRSVEVDPETGQPEFSDVLEQKRKNLQDFITPEKKTASAKPKITSAASPEATTGAGEDLTAEWQKSVDQIKAQKGGVRTTADPKVLADRWGVSEKSLAEGREQTRGWTKMETEAELKKLEARYRKGEPVEPVMETRDKDNNLIDVDGRGRAIAAKRAGVKRIPVIVRRLQ
jgi:hypothetical protein